MAPRRKKADVEKDLEEAREQLRLQQEEKEEKKERAREKKRLEKKLEELLSSIAKGVADLNKPRKQSLGQVGFVDEGSMELEVEAEKIGEAEQFLSPDTVIGGLPFRISCRRVTKDGIPNLAVGLHCHSMAASKTWSAMVQYWFSLGSSESPNYCDIFSAAKAIKECPDFLPWADAVDPAEGFIKDGHFTIEAQIRVIWHYKNAVADFSSADPELTDVTLLVGGKEIYANKSYLAHYAEYFKEIFASEMDTDLVELPEVDADEFEEMLRMISPQRTQTKVTEDNVEYLLHLANFFDVPFVSQKCSDYLMDTADFSITTKLRFTEEFRLPELQHHLVEGMESADDCAALLTSPEFGDLSETMKKYVREKHFKLSSAE